MISRSRSAPTRETPAAATPCDRVDHDGLACAAANAAKTFVRLDPLRAQSDPAARRQWWTLACRRDTSSQSNTRQSGDVSTSTDFRSPHRFGEAAPERVARNG